MFNNVEVIGLGKPGAGGQGGPGGAGGPGGLGGPSGNASCNGAPGGLGGWGGGGGGGGGGNVANLVLDQLTRCALDISKFKRNTTPTGEKIPGGLGGLGGANDANDTGIKDYFAGVNGNPGAEVRYFDIVTIDSTGAILSPQSGN